MSSIPETGTSYSIASTPETEYPALAGAIEVDVCVFGAGITGVAPVDLTRAGKRVALVESKQAVHRIPAPPPS